MRIAIIGTGAMGSLFAGLLAPLAEVVMIGSWPEQLQAVQEKGLILYHLDGHESRHVLKASTHGADAAPADLALVAVKGWQTDRAARRAQQALSPEGLALTLQNGLGNVETLGAVVGAERVALGVTSEGATMLGAGVVRHAGRGHTHVAATHSTRHRLQQAVQLFVQAGLAASLVDDAQGLSWGKLAVNAGINPLTALLQVPNGFLVQDPRALAVMQQAAEEVAVVAGAMGIELPFEDAAERAAEVARATARNRSSMAQDIARGMPTEIEQISGAVVRHGRLANVPTPVNEALLALVRAKIRGGSWASSIDDLRPEMRETFRQLSQLETAS